MRQIDPREIATNPIRLIGDQWMLVTAGKLGNFNMMTASWGCLGELWYKPVAFVFIRPPRYTFEFVEREDRLTLSFFDETYRQALQICGTKSGRDIDKVAETGLTPYETELGSVAFHEASLVLECRKLYADMLKKEHFLVPEIYQRSYSASELHKMFIVEIERAWTK